MYGPTVSRVRVVSQQWGIRKDVFFRLKCTKSVQYKNIEWFQYLFQPYSALK